MTKYGITLRPNSQEEYYEIEANSEQEAKEEAYEMCNNNMFGEIDEIEILDEDELKND